MIGLLGQNFTIYEGDGKHPQARTGELSVRHFKQAGASGMILGHSEVGDTPEIVNLKWKECLKQGVEENVVLVGEEWDDLGGPWDSLTEGKQQQVAAVMKTKLRTIMNGVPRAVIEKTVFGYEPGWGVRGSGKAEVPPPGLAQITAMSALMREIIGEISPIIYGGSMSVDRVDNIMRLRNIDGFILGSVGIEKESIAGIGESMARISIEKMSGIKPVLVLNWKAYELKTTPIVVIELLKKFSGTLRCAVAPSATECKQIGELL